MKTNFSPKKQTMYRLRKRKEWRQRSINAAIKLATWKTGVEGREAVQIELSKCLLKIEKWCSRHSVVVGLIQKRAVAAFRQGGAA